MKAGDRVVFVEPVRGRQVGTVARTSPAGYVTVRWDDGTTGHFSPLLAMTRLELAEGAAARPRHQWNDDQVCEACGAEQTDDNEFAACDPAPPAARPGAAGADA
jgi:hypothetical protein